MQLKIGILIIGSLYWSGEGKRDHWRRTRLNMTAESTVNVPIRYGRLSKSGTYTMVFAPTCPLGQAKVVPCARNVSCLNDLSTEARWLWAAEVKEVPESEAGLGDSVARSWGCVGLLPNPDSQVPESLLTEWREFIASDRQYVANEARCINENGLLQLRWPTLAGGQKQLPLDLLLATANDPTLACATVTSIADAWNRNPNQTKYFKNNRNSGIQTFEDKAIAMLIMQ